MYKFENLNANKSVIFIVTQVQIYLKCEICLIYSCVIDILLILFDMHYINNNVFFLYA